MLVALLKELRGWEGRRYGRKPLIIELHDKIIESDPTAERGVINEGTTALALYTALEEPDKGGDPCRALAVLAYHFVVSIPPLAGTRGRLWRC